MEDTYHNIDQAIRRKFEHFSPEPPEAIWKNIQSQIGNPPPSTPIIQVILPVITGLILLVAFLLIQFIYNPAANTSLQSTDMLQGSIERSGTWLASIQNSSEILPYVNNQVDLSDQVVETAPVRTNGSGIPVRAPFNGSSYNTAFNDTQRDGQHTDRNQTSDIRSSGRNIDPPQRFEAPGRLNRLDPGMVSGLDNTNGSKDFSSRITSSSRDPEYFKKTRSTLSLGLCFNPEITFYPSGNWDKGTNLSFGFMPALRFDKMFLQSGINIRITRDAGKYEIKYNQYLGQYEDVYLVTFDTVDNVVIPTYHTETVDVYDTLDHYYITPTTAKYTYLEIPVLVGYQETFNRLSWYVKGGPSFSFIANRILPDANIDGEQARILNVDRQVPVRADLNWQIMAAAGVDFRFSRHMSFSFEPTIRYFLSPEIRSGIDSGSKPFAVGMRAGIIYHFKD